MLKAEQGRAADEANKQIQKLHDGAKGCLLVTLDSDSLADVLQHCKLKSKL